MKRMGIAAIAISAVLAVACNGNERSSAELENSGAVGTAGRAVADSGDRTFIEHMMDANLTEVDLGKMAASRAASSEVKQFASMMAREHSKAEVSLNAIASRQGIPELAQREENHRDLKARLEKLRGAEFDREYMAAMVDGHEEVLDMLQSRVNEDHFGDNKGAVTPEKANDPVEANVNQWAADTLPVVKHHLEEAKEIQDHLKNRNTTN
jgi:putative membrane protein